MNITLFIDALIQLLLLSLLFVLGEWIVNKVIFSRLKDYFSIAKKHPSQEEKLRGLPISTWKGILERLVLMIFLVFEIHSILIVFGALKIATRIQPDPEHQGVQMDYFLIGNLFTILIALLYSKAYLFIISSLLGA